MFLINSISRELAEWRMHHDGKWPSKVVLSQALYDALGEEMKNNQYARKIYGFPQNSATICGVPVLIDPNKSLGEIIA